MNEKQKAYIEQADELISSIYHKTMVYNAGTGYGPCGNRCEVPDAMDDIREMIIAFWEAFGEEEGSV